MVTGHLGFLLVKGLVRRNSLHSYIALVVLAETRPKSSQQENAYAQCRAKPCLLSVVSSGSRAFEWNM